VSVHYHHHHHHHNHHRHPHSLLPSSSVCSQNSTGLSDLALLIHCCAKNFLTIQHGLNTAACCIGIYRTGRRLSSVKLTCNLFGLTPAVDSTVGIIQGVFSCHIVTRSCFKSVYYGDSRWPCCEGCDCWKLLRLLSVLLMVLSSITVSGLLLRTVWSAVMDLSFYSL
jgi:hypothetical protein